MKTIYVIQDIKTKEYYWQFMASEGFDPELDNAFQFISEKEALSVLVEAIDSNILSERYIEIKKYHIFDEY